MNVFKSLVEEGEHYENAGVVFSDIGECLFLLGEQENAYHHALKAAGLTRDLDVDSLEEKGTPFVADFQLLGKLQWFQGEIEEALETLGKAWKEESRAWFSMTFLQHYYLLLLQNNKPQQAEEAFQTLKSYDPSFFQ